MTEHAVVIADGGPTGLMLAGELTLARLIKAGEIIYKDVGPIGVMVTEPDTNATTEATLQDLKALHIAVCGTD